MDDYINFIEILSQEANIILAPRQASGISAVAAKQR